MTLSLKQSKLTSQNSSNGGRFTKNSRAQTAITQKLSAIAVPYSDRLIKSFVYNDSETTEENLAITLDFPQVSPNTAVFSAPGTQRDTQATFAPARYYGIGKLAAAKIIGDSVITVQFPTGAAALDVVMAGDVLLLRSPVSAGARADTIIETVTIDSLIWTVDSAAITLVAPLTKNWAQYSTAASAITEAALAAGFDNVVATNCTIDDTQIVLTNGSTIEETFTFTFSSGTAFSCVGDSVGALANGTIGSQYAPLNPATNSPYITIPAATWLTAITGATLVLQTHPAAVPVWELCRFMDGETAQAEVNAASLFVSGY